MYQKKYILKYACVYVENGRHRPGKGFPQTQSQSDVLPLMETLRKHEQMERR